LEATEILLENFGEKLSDGIMIPGILVAFILIIKLLDFVIRY
jgi:hypothetical protein